MLLLEEYYEEGWLIKQTHPTLPLTIWNYSQKTQYEGKWDEITLRCRGLVTDDEGNIVARPFKKFFNIEEAKHNATKEFDVYEKMDGSLGIFFYFKGEPVFASRGSFTSEQAIKGTELLDKYNWERGTYEGYTYMFEILYPENRIVVDYGEEEKLVVLGVINTTTGEDCKFDEMESEGFNIVKKYHTIKNYEHLKSLNWENKEGFVVKFENGDRCKIKFEDYLRLHKIMTEISTKSVWECLSKGDDIYEMLKDVPDEFFKGIDAYIEELKSEYKSIEVKTSATFDLYKDLNRKDFAESVKWNKYAPILFKRMDGKDYSDAIWRVIKPKYKKL
jgi:RNA ligase